MMRVTASTMTPVRFDLPPEARTFPLFAALPAEIRYQIWEHAIREPSMHFLKLVVDSDSSDMSNADSDASHDAQETQAQHQAPHPTVTVASPVSPSPANPRAIKTRQARLAPLYPHPRADSSRYVDTNRRLSILSASCAEAAQVVRRLLHQPTTLKLADDRAVSLGRHSPDIICLDYMSDDDSRFFNGCRIRYDVQCPGLDRIRHVAVRYCHQWEARSNPCPRCRRRHDPYSQRTYPVHVFQFLARQLPNLQTFYFIDYLILPKKPAVSQSDGSQQLMRRKFFFFSSFVFFFFFFLLFLLVMPLACAIPSWHRYNTWQKCPAFAARIGPSSKYPHPTTTTGPSPRASSKHSTGSETTFVATPSTAPPHRAATRTRIPSNSKCSPASGMLPGRPQVPPRP